MDLLVAIKVAWGSKCSFALRTPVWFLSSVSSNVHLEIVRTVRGIVTLITAEHLLELQMTPCVATKMLHARKQSFTLFTFKLFFNFTG